MDTLNQNILNFSVIKEKIIKTDEVLKLLKKSQHESKEWKNKYKQSSIALKRSQLESDRFSTNIEALKMKQKPLEEENKNLSEQYAHLEEKYNIQIVDSMKLVRDLQDEVRMLQELNSAQGVKEISLDPPEKDLNKENGYLKLQVADMVKEKKKIQEENSDKQKQLQMKLQLYSGEITDLKSQIKSILGNSSADKEKLKHLEKQVLNLNLIKDQYEKLQQENKRLSSQLSQAKVEIQEYKSVRPNKTLYSKSIQTENVLLKEKYTTTIDLQPESEEEKLRVNPYFNQSINTVDFGIQTDNIILVDKGITTDNLANPESEHSDLELQGLKTRLCKQNNKQNSYLLENEKLIEKLKVYEENIKFLEIQVNSLKSNMLSQSESVDSAIDSDFEPDFVLDILSEMMIVPRLISPLSCHESIPDETIESQDVPSIVITPSVTHEEPKSELIVNSSQAVTETSPELEEQQNPSLNLLKRRRNKTCFSYNDFIRQQGWHLRQKMLKRKLNQKKKKIDDGFLNSLQALKKSNINFVISNEPTVPQETNDNSHSKPVANKQCIPIRNMENLTCNLNNCQAKYMLLDNTSTGSELLGFFSLKPEENKSTIFGKGCSPKKVIPVPEPILKSEIITTDFINKIAEVVCDKLKKEGVALEKTKACTPKTESLDSLCSETETEIEQLFKKHPLDILKQNKMLLQEARYRNLHISTDDSSHTDETSSDIRSYTLSISDGPSSHCSDISDNFQSISSGDGLKRVVTNRVPQNNANNCFKVPVCPKLLSPICSTISDMEKSPLLSTCPQILSPMYLTPKPSTSVQKLTFSPGFKLENSVNSNVSLYINKILEDRQNSAYKVNKFLGRSEEKSASNCIDLVNVDIPSSMRSSSKSKETEDRVIELHIEDTTASFSNNNLRELSSIIDRNYAKSPPKVIPPERHKSISNDSSESEFSRRRSKRILGKNSTEIRSNKIRKSNSLESLQSEEDILKPCASIQNNLGRVKLEVDEIKETNLNCDTLKESCTKNKFVGRDRKQFSGLTPDKIIKKNRKPVSKLKSRILQQMRVKTEMMNNRKLFNDYGCDKLDTSSTVVEDNMNLSPKEANVCKNDDDTVQHLISTVPFTTVSPFSKQDTSNSLKTNTIRSKTKGKINIVQNILIPAHSRFAIDLLKDNKKQNVAQRDVLCDILHHMDEVSPKKVTKEVGTKQIVSPVGIDDKTFRDNVLDIAEVVHGGMKCYDFKIDDMQGRNSVLDSKILKKGKNLNWTLKAILAKLYESSDEGNISKEVIIRFKRLPMTDIVDIILNQVSKNFNEKPTAQYVNAPLLTEKQKLFLCLMLRLEKEKYPQMTDTFLSRTERYVLYRGCNIRYAVPIVRLYLTICRLRGDITRVRKFVSDSFYLIGDAAIAICFAVLTNWVEVLPKWENLESFPLAKVLFQVIHLKQGVPPGHNLFPLKCLLVQYYGFPKERFNCDEFFKELYDQYLTEPSPERELAIRLLCKNKPKQWIYEKMNQFFKPLVYKIPSENVNFKATIIILLGKLSAYFRPKIPVEEGYLTELRRWFLGLVEDGAAKVIEDSVCYVTGRLPKKKFNKKVLRK